MALRLGAVAAKRALATAGAPLAGEFIVLQYFAESSLANFTSSPRLAGVQSERVRVLGLKNWGILLVLFAFVRVLVHRVGIIDGREVL